MEEHELINGKPNEQEAEKPSETIFQIKDDEWKKAVEIILGIDKHEEISDEDASDLITAARNFRKIIDFFVKLFGGAL